MRSSRPSVAELRAVAQPPDLLARRSAEHWAGRLYMRRISIYATWLGVRAGLSANATTGLMIVVGLGAAAALAAGGLAGAVGALVLVQVYLLLDCSDGEIARWTGTQSVVGVYLDRVGHYVVESAVMVGLGVGVGRGDGLAWVVWGLAAAVLVMLEKAETDLVDVARSHAGRASAPDTAATMRSGPLARGRRIAGAVPLHRLTHAIEATLLVLAAAIVDEVSGETLASRVLLVAFATTSAVVVVLHLVSILNSRRLVAP
jgi:phosphatidylglycerophosphate synthase